MSPRTSALRDLSAALDAPRRTSSQAALGSWRWRVRQRMAAVRDLLISESAQHQDTWLAAETSSGTDGWLVARGATTLRRRNTLLGRVSRLGSQVVEAADVSGVRRELARLVVDVQHHRQRLHDLAYDEVALELGGED